MAVGEARTSPVTVSRAHPIPGLPACTTHSACELQFPHLHIGCQKNMESRSMLCLYAPGWLIPRATLSVIPEYLDTSPKLCCLQITTAKAVPRVQDGLLLSNLLTLGMGLTLLDIRYF